MNASAKVRVTRTPPPDAGPNTPTQEVLASARTEELIDSRGRRLLIRELSALESIRFVRLVGAEAANNTTWMQMATAAAIVRKIDDTEYALPGSVDSVEKKFDLIGEEGLVAIMKAARERADAKAEEAGLVDDAKK